MNLSLMQIIAAVVMAGLTIALVFAYRKYLAANTKRRMRTMLESHGLDSALVSSGDTETIVNEIHRRCQSCASEDRCEQWLRGEEDGVTDFCPNSKAFEILMKYSGNA